MNRTPAYKARYLSPPFALGRSWSWCLVLQRVAVAVSCTLFFILVRGWATSEAWKTGSLLILVVLSCVEKLASIMNLVSIERDWVFSDPVQVQL